MKTIIDYDSDNDIIFENYAGIDGTYAKIISKEGEKVYLSFRELKEMYNHIKKYIPLNER
jgi:hypothetical protein